MSFGDSTADSVPGLWTPPPPSSTDSLTGPPSPGGGDSPLDHKAHPHPRACKARLDTASGYSPQPWDASKLSTINGEINKMSKQELQDKMAAIRLNTCGSKDVLKKRIKNHYKKLRLGATASNSPDKLKYRYLVVIDFEATCSQTNENFVHEIIEFPAILVDAQNMAVCNVFQRYCKPSLNPKLTEFCTNLTGISQSQVDKAKPFPEVLQEFEDWMVLNKLGTEHRFNILTDGPWDMARFLRTQTHLSHLPYPPWAKHWVNLRKAYSAFYGVGRVNLQYMLDDLGMTFQGRPHSGLDDARNIASIVIRLIKDGCVFRTNESLHEGPPSPSRPHHHHSNAQGGRSPNGGTNAKSRLTQTKKTDSSVDDGGVPQEGDNMADLFDLIRIQQS